MSATSHGHGHGHGHSEPGADPKSVAIGHELKDAQARPLVLSAVGLFALLAVSFASMALLMFVAGVNVDQTGNTLPNDTVTQQQVPPAPRLEQNPVVDGDQIIAEATERLETYGWADEQAGTAHIPIERAMDLLVERGLNGQ